MIFDKSVKPFSGERIVFSTNDAGIHMQKNEVESLPNTIYKN